MKTGQKTHIAIGILLLLAGIWLFAMMMFPELQSLVQIQITWPLIIVGVGAVLFLFGLFLGTPSLLIPACILGGIGGLLYWQNLTGNWESWAYAWALIPGFSGVGQVLAGLLGASEQHLVQKGLWQIFISLILFVIFGSFLGNLSWLGPFWPLLLILAGLVLVVRGIIKNRQ